MSALAITFDDGPDEHWTPVLLDALEKHDVRATFFLVAPRAQAHSALVTRMLDQGHSVGLHCETHVRHSESDRDSVELDTDRALARLSDVGVTPTLWRTPWGDTASWTAAIARRHGLRLVGWSVDTHDWRGDSAAEMFTATRRRLRPGAVVLAHDGIGPGARREDASQTVAYVEMVARQARADGLRLEALS